MAKELLFSLSRKDFRVEAFRGGGNGGQNRNVTNSACRITHPPSGAVGQAQDERQYMQNEKLAFKRLLATAKFKIWHQQEVFRCLGILKQIDETVDKQMKEIKVEVKNENGLWQEEESHAI